MTDNAAESAPLALGSLWEIKSKDAVKIQRPDGSEVTVASDGKVAGHVLDVPGTYAADAQIVTVG